ncbi:MAG: penicillin-binding protein 2 [Candidatus Paceibacterota bacterium]
MSYVRYSSYSRTASAQRDNINNILARGNIYLKDAQSGDLFLAATNKKSPLVYLVPAKADWSENTEMVETLASLLGVEEESIKKLLATKQDVSKVLKRGLTIEEVANVKDLGLKGLGISYEMDRFYPAYKMAANTIGFLGYSQAGRSGQYGIEAFYNDDLFGKKNKEQEFPRPADIVLTIDKNIQDFIENRLENLIKKWDANGGTIIVQDPETGKILAMADNPSFDPNDYSDFPIGNFLNRSVQGVFEPGSSFKPITMAMGFDLAKVTPQTTFTDTGFVEIAGYKIKNFSERVFGTVTMSQVLEKSINTGAMFVENSVGDDNFLNYVINMGFGQKTGIDLPGEVGGDITNLYSGRKINYLTASFGQGIAVTPIQMVNAYSTIANGGKLMRPYVVEKIIGEGGVEEVTRPEVISIPISEKTSAKLKSMLVSVVDNGFDKARINGYDIAGKTGTAQIPDGRGGYSDNEYIHDFLGFAPAFNPKFVIFIKMDKPKGITFAADSLSPTFREITQFLLNYYKIPPTRQ